MYVKMYVIHVNSHFGSVHPTEHEDRYADRPSSSPGEYPIGRVITLHEIHVIIFAHEYFVILAVEPAPTFS